MKNNISREEAAQELKKGQEKFTEDDLKKVVDKSDEIRDKFESSGSLGRFLDDFKLLISVIKDYYKGKYRRIPWWAIAAIGFALLYVLSPLDMVPDVLPFFGLVDDSTVVAACLLMVEQELQKYGQWKNEKDIPISDS